MKVLKNLRKKGNNKGFTLVELIVVLVILAILAAILVPALLGYIDRARNSQALLNAKSCLTAAQAEMSSLYGEGKKPSDITSRAKQVLETADVTDCKELVVGTAGPANAAATSDNHNAFKINYVKYEENGKDPVYFDGSTWITVTGSATEPTAPAATFTLKTEASN